MASIGPRIWAAVPPSTSSSAEADSFASIPADDPFWELPIGDPGPERLFDFPVYARGAMTLHALRLEVGDADFFRIIRRWASTRAGDNVTTREFIRHAERTSGEELDALFATWLGSGKPPMATAERRSTAAAASLADAPAAVRSLVSRLRDRAGQPFTEVRMGDR